jgi:hypothetical protein
VISCRLFFAVADLVLELLDLSALPAAHVDQRGNPKTLDAVVAFDHGGVGLHDHQPVDWPGRTEHADEILAVADRLAQSAARAVLVEKTIEAGPTPALDFGRRHRHQSLERLVDIDDALLLAGDERHRDCDRGVIEQMLVSVVLDG